MRLDLEEVEHNYPMKKKLESISRKKNNYKKSYAKKTNYMDSKNKNFSDKKNTYFKDHKDINKKYKSNPKMHYAKRTSNSI